jgi:hypothetical protein
MHYRTRYKLTAVPYVIVAACLSAIGLVAYGPVGPWLRRQWAHFPMVVLLGGGLLTLAMALWYLTSYVEVRRSTLALRSKLDVQAIDLKLLVRAEVSAKDSKHGSTLILRLEDEEGRELFLPLGAWRDEDLLMARVLRATVDRRVRIEGDPRLVKRFSGMLDTYKSWDRQRAAA